ncbi:hypothetical protein B1H20_18155 [Streptomyces violaceoruber]|uniref:Uncharacterized protein n=1 Tax=Streptomyces violaceoruber TaxID=1935 RepID=A0A1V0UCW7_STRVN|nr:hypothetical protein B1H20_18155 [Streptomyces violaceoruber]
MPPGVVYFQWSDRRRYESVAESELPDWTDNKMGSMVRAALWLATQVGEGNVYTKDQLRAAFPDVAQIDRRVRDLRELGWVIATNREDPQLAPNEAQFVRAGAAVWEPGVIRASRQQRQSKSLARLLEPEALRVRAFDDIRLRQAPDPEAVWGRLKDLSQPERSIILAWIAMGYRPSSSVELAWRAFRGLSEEQRQEMAVRLGELVSSELYEELPTSGGLKGAP